MTPLENKNSNPRPKEIDEAIETSIYYGFSPIETPVIEEINPAVFQKTPNDAFDFDIFA